MSVCMSPHKAENRAKLRSPLIVQTPFPAHQLQLSFSRNIVVSDLSTDYAEKEGLLSFYFTNFTSGF